MEKSADVFTWTYKLECPKTVFNESVKKTLCSGLVELLWDELSDSIFSAEEAKTIRKNVLLQHLKQKTSNKVVECMKSLLQLKSDKNDIKNQISKLEEKYEQQDFKVRQKAKTLKDISSKRSEIRARRDLFKMKHDQTSTQLDDCNHMILFCQHLMPSTCKDIDHKVLKEMLSAVTSLWNGANKRQVWDTVSSNLDHIEIPTLWFHLHQNLRESVNTLTNAKTMNPMESSEKSINVGLAGIYGQHICMVSKRLLCNAKANNHQQNVLEFIEKIEVASNNSTDIIEWLALALEVHKLETEQKCLRAEIYKILNDVHERNQSVVDLEQLIMEIQNINAKIAGYVQDVQQSLKLLKSAPTFLMKAKEKINSELQKIVTMRADGYDCTMLNNSLTTELDIFNALNLNALRKIMLKGDIGVYRHTKSCFSEASISLPNSQMSNIISYFPLIQTPIYSLIECYKNLISMYVYKTFESLKTEENQDVFHLPVLTYEENNCKIFELLNLVKMTNVKTKTEIDEFNEILTAWVNQTVQKVMKVIDATVDHATFPQWKNLNVSSCYKH